MRYPSSNPYKYTNKRINWEKDVADSVKDQLKDMSNADLFAEYTDLARGDDYDGCYTDGGRITYDLVAEELYARLIKLKFFEE